MNSQTRNAPNGNQFFLITSRGVRRRQTIISIIMPNTTSILRYLTAGIPKYSPTAAKTTISPIMMPTRTLCIVFDIFIPFISYVRNNWLFCHRQNVCCALRIHPKYIAIIFRCGLNPASALEQTTIQHTLISTTRS